MSEWRDIETAPKDGTEIVCVDAKTGRVGKAVYRHNWHKREPAGAFVVPFSPGSVSATWWGEPTHWIPLPPKS